MRIKKPQNPVSRRGSMTLELVLILPIILLVAAIIYQVSVMLMTYQAIQGASYVAVKVAARAGDNWDVVENDVKSAVATAVSGWYFAPLFTSGTDGMVDIYKKEGTEWKKIGENSEEISWDTVHSSDFIAVQIKLTNLAGNAKTKHYWLLPQFKGVDEPNDTLTVNAVCVRK